MDFCKPDILINQGLPASAAVSYELVSTKVGSGPQAEGQVQREEISQPPVLPLQQQSGIPAVGPWWQGARRQRGGSSRARS